MKKRIQKSLCALLALLMLLSIAPIPSVSAAPAGDRLDGWNETIYDFLKASVADVASGQQASTQFSLRDTNGIMVWSKEELGVSTLVSNTSITAEAQAALNTKFAEVVDLDAIMNSLMADCPYDLYWYDKVTGVLMSYSMSANANEMKITNITFKLAVCQEYSAGQYTVDTALTQSMAAVTDNAMAIVEEHANKSDWDKLVAYKDEICELVAYNHSAADNPSTPYGNPWQLIYVFDKDPSTNVVCEGYAKAFKLLCDLSSFQGDVYCYTVSGTMQGGTGAGNHMWNVVDINGGRLMVDVTNCDAGTIGAPDQLFLTAGTQYGDAYGFPASNSIIYYTYDPDEYGLYTDGYLELTPIPEQTEDPDISTAPTTPIDPLAIKFDEIVGYCDTFYESIPWYVVCKLSWDLIDWNYDGEPPVLQIPAAEYEAAAAKYCVLTESLLTAIRNETDYEGNPIYNPDTNTYTVFFVGGWGGFMHNRVYAGYVQTGADTYDIYYETINFEFLDEILPDGTSLEDVVGEDWPETVEYEGYTYTNGPDGYYRIVGCAKSGIKYGVKYDGENVMIATRTPYSVGQQPENFDDITIEDILTYEIVNGEAIITDCDDSVSGEITIPATLGGYPVTTIAEFAFAHLTNPISVNTGNSVKTISGAAFLGCYGLQSITLGDSVQSVDTKAFEACENLQSFAVSANNANFSSVNGVLYNKNQTVLLCAPKTLSGEFTVPAGVLTVGEYAFDGCMYLTDLVFGNDVTTIGKRAFNNCMNLTNVKLGSSVKTIDEYAFMNCSRINKLIAPLSLSDIKDHAFERCTGLTDIYYAGTESQWIAINIGGNNEPIDNATIHYESDGSAPADPWYLSYEIVNGEAIITDCDESVSGEITIPATLGGYPVASIGGNAFYSCKDITEIFVPSSVTSIGENAFRFCGLTEIHLPDGLISIGSGAFHGCERLTNITIPDSVAYIGDGAFCCTCLDNITLPSSLTSISSSLFAESGLNSIIIPDGVTSIGDCAFEMCDNLTITIPASVTSIGERAFEFCSRLNVYYCGTAAQWTQINIAQDNSYLISAQIHFTDLSYDIDFDAYITDCNEAYTGSVIIPNRLGGLNVCSIGDWAFKDCTGITEIHIPQSITFIGEGAFNNCYSLTDVYYDGTEDQWEEIYICGDNFYLTSANIHFVEPEYLTYNIYEGGAYITGCDSSFSGALEIPDTLGGYPVVGIDPYAFQYCTDITEIHLPDSVRTIGYSAFEHCSSLTTVTMSDNVTTIGSSAFTGCTNLSDIDIPDGITTIEDHTFDGCESLTNIVIPDGVAVIRDAAFARCYSLTNIEIPGSVSIIGDYAFTDCTSLINVILPYGVTNIGRDAFRKCTSLQSISLPNSLGSIGMYAFKECNWLKSIVIPDSVTYVGAHAFEYCSNLKTAVIGSGLTHISNGMFWANVSLKEITIPATVTDIDLDVFHFCDNLTDVYYLGTEAQKQNIAIEDPVIAAATWHCNSCIGSADHSYDNGCDAECNVCFAQRTVAHTFDNACDTTCNVCPFTRTTSHSWNSGVVTKKATCKETGVKTFTCSTCKGTKTEPIAKLTTHTYDHACDTSCNVCSATRKTSHSYKTTTTKATLSKNGSIVKKCTVCGHTASSTTIRYVKTITLSTTTYTYDGKTKTPSVTVKDSAGNVLTKDTDYTVSYSSGRKAVGTYNVVITLKGNYSGSKTLTFTIKPAPAKVTSQPKTQKVEVGEKIKFTVGASGDGLKYQWQSSSNGKTWKNCSSSSAKKATFSFTSKTSHNGNYYRCKVTDSSGNVVYTSAVRAYVLGVTTQPKTQKVESGDKIKLTVKATGDGLKYQWQSSTNGKTWKNCSSSSAKKATFSFTSKTSHNGNYYRCKVTDSAGNVVYTSAVRAYVLGIKDQPDSKTVTKGKTAKFTVEATGASVKYQWQVSTNGGKTWKNCTSSSAKKATFSFTTKTSHSGNYYRCKITDSAKNSMYTSKAKLTVKK